MIDQEGQIQLALLKKQNLEKDLLYQKNSHMVTMFVTIAALTAVFVFCGTLAYISRQEQETKRYEIQNKAAKKEKS